MDDYLFNVDNTKTPDYSLQQAATKALENGKVVLCPKLNFELYEHETELLKLLQVNTLRKNISFDSNTNTLKSIKKGSFDQRQISQLMDRFNKFSLHLVHSLFPHYKTNLMIGRTSLRPVEIDGRKIRSYRQDDKRLHVDAFPATPMQGQRILRVFSNINPDGKPRVWRLGEPFHAVVLQFKNKFSSSQTIFRQLLRILKLTKRYRTLYDHYMLQLHDNMKGDLSYQQQCKQTIAEFLPGHTWIVFTDTVSHAATHGQHLLEQTFYLDPKHMQNYQLSPLAILEENFDTALLV